MKRQEVRPLQKNDIRTCEITDFGENGEGIGRASGIPVFVSGALIGDTVKIKITKVKKKMAYARVEEILLPSPDRVAPACPVAAQCGGCQIMSYAYPAQLKYKEQKIRSLLQRIGHFDAEEIDDVLHPVIGMEAPYRFRNKAQVPVGGASSKAVVQPAASARADARALPACAEECTAAGARDIVTGYYATHSHRIVPHEDCLIGDPLNAEILAVIRNHMMQYDIPPYDEETHTGLVRHVLIRRGFATGEVMICLVLNRRAEEDEAFIPAQDRLTESLQLCVKDFAERHKQSAYAGNAAAGLQQNGYKGCCGSQPSCLVSICMNFNPQRTNVILGKETRTIHGRPYIEDVLSGLRFRISAQSFYQTNPYITERLYG
ncbi:MAG: class I SAM-dependent RNA methyltransferase, partial [Lachnospiraceae bacterium]|nr:class I SAM-dependent RNA methyltransferase [Lachnospiraceae bacterium]